MPLSDEDAAHEQRTHHQIFTENHGHLLHNARNAAQWAKERPDDTAEHLERMENIMFSAIDMLKTVVNTWDIYIRIASVRKDLEVVEVALQRERGTSYATTTPLDQRVKELRIQGLEKIKAELEAQIK